MGKERTDKLKTADNKFLGEGKTVYIVGFPAGKSTLKVGDAQIVLADGEAKIPYNAEAWGKYHPDGILVYSTLEEAHSAIDFLHEVDKILKEDAKGETDIGIKDFPIKSLAKTRNSIKIYPEEIAKIMTRDVILITKKTLREFLSQHLPERFEKKTRWH